MADKKNQGRNPGNTQASMGSSRSQDNMGKSTTASSGTSRSDLDRDQDNIKNRRDSEVQGRERSSGSLDGSRDSGNLRRDRDSSLSDRDRLNRDRDFESE